MQELQYRRYRTKQHVIGVFVGLKSTGIKTTGLKTMEEIPLKTMKEMIGVRWDTISVPYAHRQSQRKVASERIIMYLIEMML